MWSDPEWSALVRDLQQVADVDVMVAAASRLLSGSIEEDVPKLNILLQEDSAFVREAAAWPLTELTGVALLPALLPAFQRGIDDGHDNDGFATALIGMVEADSEKARSLLSELLASGDAAMRDNARWLLEFCEPSDDRA